MALPAAPGHWGHLQVATCKRAPPTLLPPGLLPPPAAPPACRDPKKAGSEALAWLAAYMQRIQDELEAPDWLARTPGYTGLIDGPSWVRAGGKLGRNLCSGWLTAGLRVLVLPAWLAPPPSAKG